MAAEKALGRPVHTHPLSLATSALYATVRSTLPCSVCKDALTPMQLRAAWTCRSCQYVECAACVAASSEACVAGAAGKTAPVARRGHAAKAPRVAPSAPQAWIDIVASHDLAPAVAGRVGAVLLAKSGVFGCADLAVSEGGASAAAAAATVVVACELCPAAGAVGAGGAPAAASELLEVSFSLTPEGSESSSPAAARTFLLRRLRARRAGVERPATSARALLLLAAGGAPPPLLAAALEPSALPSGWWLAPPRGDDRAPVALANLAFGPDAAVATGRDGGLYVLVPPGDGKSAAPRWRPLVDETSVPRAAVTASAQFAPTDDAIVSEAGSRVALDDGKWALSADKYIVDEATKSVLTWAFKVDCPPGENPDMGFGLATLPHDAARRGALSRWGLE